MLAKAQKSDLFIGNLVEYCGKTYRIQFVDNKFVYLLIPGQLPNSLYQPYPSASYTALTSLKTLLNDYDLRVFK